MDEYPKRKNIRIRDYDYSTPGAYFITICTSDRKPILWHTVGADIIRPDELPLSPIGKIVEQAVLQINEHYSSVEIDFFCIMPDHIHLLLCINRRMVSAPTISTVVGSLKRWVSRQVGTPIWQKSFYEHCIRNEKDYGEIWTYIANNPLKYAIDQDSHNSIAGNKIIAR